MSGSDGKAVEELKRETDIALQNLAAVMEKARMMGILIQFNMGQDQFGRMQAQNVAFLKPL